MDVLLASAGQLSPARRTLRRRRTRPPTPRQTAVLLASAGQASLTPSQSSARSQAPAEARHCAVLLASAGHGAARSGAHLSRVADTGRHAAGLAAGAELTSRGAARGGGAIAHALVALLTGVDGTVAAAGREQHGRAVVDHAGIEGPLEVAAVRLAVHVADADGRGVAVVVGVGRRRIEVLHQDVPRALVENRFKRDEVRRRRRDAATPGGDVPFDHQAARRGAPQRLVVDGVGARGVGGPIVPERRDQRQVVGDVLRGCRRRGQVVVGKREIARAEGDQTVGGGEHRRVAGPVEVEGEAEGHGDEAVVGVGQDARAGAGDLLEGERRGVGRREPRRIGPDRRRPRGAGEHHPEHRHRNQVARDGMQSGRGGDSRPGLDPVAAPRPRRHLRCRSTHVPRHSRAHDVPLYPSFDGASEPFPHFSLPM